MAGQVQASGLPGCRGQKVIAPNAILMKRLFYIVLFDQFQIVFLFFFFKFICLKILFILLICFIIVSCVNYNIFRSKLIFVVRVYMLKMLGELCRWNERGLESSEL